jgi:predicted O-methyltransferase YrrM
MDGDLLPREVHDYLASLRPALSPVMRRLEQEAVREGQPAVNPDAGNLLRVLTAASGGRRVLEVGTNLGYGALWMAAGMAPDGRLDTIELDPEMVRRARENFQEAGLGDRITVHEGAALSVLPGLPRGAYDLAFLDCVKSEYPAYLAHARRLVRPGGLVVADNLLWHGDAWRSEVQDEDTRGIRAYTTAIRSDARILTSVVPVGDGLGVSVVLP